MKWLTSLPNIFDKEVTWLKIKILFHKIESWGLGLVQWKSPLLLSKNVPEIFIPKCLVKDLFDMWWKSSILFHSWGWSKKTEVQIFTKFCLFCLDEANKFIRSNIIRGKPLEQQYERTRETDMNAIERRVFSDLKQIRHYFNQLKKSNMERTWALLGTYVI